MLERHHTANTLVAIANTKILVLLSYSITNQTYCISYTNTNVSRLPASRHLVALDVGHLATQLRVHTALGQSHLGALAQLRIRAGHRSNAGRGAADVTSARRRAQGGIRSARQTLVADAHVWIGAVPRDVVGSVGKTHAHTDRE